MSEDALDHIEKMPFTMSKIDLTEDVNFVILSEDRLYTAIGLALYVYSVR